MIDYSLPENWHEAASLFPLLENAELEKLAADIGENGQLDPIALFSGKVLDGRNRALACNKAGVSPVTYNWSPESGQTALEWVISKNLLRRHLDESQRVGLALKILPLLREEARKRQESAGSRGSEGGRGNRKPLPQIQGKGLDRQEATSAGRAAARAKVGRSVVEEMLAAEKENDKLADELLSGKTTVAKERQKQNTKKRTEFIAEVSKNSTPLDSSVPSRFPVLLVDPPWKYEFAETESRAIENHYPTMEESEISRLKVVDIATDDSVLFLWATAPKLKEAMNVLEAWGFKYTTHAIWDKVKIGMGYWFRGQHELLLVGTRGKLPPPEDSIRISSIIQEARGPHSKKPKAVYEYIERAYPTLPKCELFARETRDGWYSWGNQI